MTSLPDEDVAALLANDDIDDAINNNEFITIDFLNKHLDSDEDDDSELEELLNPTPAVKKHNLNKVRHEKSKLERIEVTKKNVNDERIL